MWDANSKSSTLTNIARLPDVNKTPVSIASVNGLNATTRYYFNPNYPDPFPDGPSPNLAMALNGTTQLMYTSIFNVTAGTKYTVKLVIADSKCLRQHALLLLFL